MTAQSKNIPQNPTQITLPAPFPTPLPTPLPLSEGQQLTYKQLVTLLHQPFYAPNNRARRTQLTNFQHYFSFTPGPGRKFTVTEVFPTQSIENTPQFTENTPQSTEKVPKNAQLFTENTSTPPSLTTDLFNFPSLSSGGVRKGKYFLPLAHIILRYLPNSRGNPIVLTPKQLYEQCGITNIHYSTAPYDSSFKAQVKNNRTNKETSWFFSRTSAQFNKIVTRQLAALQKLQAITCTERKLLIGADKASRLATKKQENEIEFAEENELYKLGLDSVSDVQTHHKTREFYTGVIQSLSFSDSIARYLNCYCIQVLNDYIPLSPEEYRYWKGRMNELILESFQQSVSSFKRTDQYNENFIEIEKDLAAQLLKIEI